MVLIFLLTAYLVIAAVYIIAFRGGSISPDTGDWGALGDYLNGLMATPIGLVTILLILRTYELQKEELEATRNELKAQRETLELQLEQMKDESIRKTLLEQGIRVFEEIMQNKELETDLRSAIQSHPNTTIQLQKTVERHTPLLKELVYLLDQTDTHTYGDTRATDYYRRRVSTRLSRVRRNENVAKLKELADVLASLTPKGKVA